MPSKTGNYVANLRKNITAKLPVSTREPVQSPNSPGAKIARLEQRFAKLLAR